MPELGDGGGVFGDLFQTRSGGSETDGAFVGGVDGLDDGDISGDVGTVLNAESEVRTIVLTRGVVVELGLFVNTDTVAVSDVAESIFDVVMTFDIVHVVEAVALDDVLEERNLNTIFFDVEFLLSAEVSSGDEGAAVAAEETIFTADIIRDEFAANSECSLVVLDGQLLDGGGGSVVGPETIMCTFR